MKYKETLFFVAKSLTISLEEKNRNEIELILKTTDVNWESVVKLSTNHNVFPALYCNYKRSKFLKYLPSDLVTYMEYITKLNRNRNLKIIQQAKKLNRLLLDNGVRAIFLKGTGNLLQGLYQDIGERMVGDIDFLFSENDSLKAIDILRTDNYYIEENQVDHFPGYRHFSRMVKQDNIAAVEVHKEVTIEKFRDEFNQKIISKNTRKIDDFYLLSFENQFSLSIISSQINDYGFELKSFSLRNAYDLFLLSKKVNAKTVISNFSKLKNTMNCFLANCNLVFGDLDSLDYFKTNESKNYLKTFSKSLNVKNSRININFKLIIINLKRRIVIVCKSIFSSENRKWLFNRIKSKISDF